MGGEEMNEEEIKGDMSKRVMKKEIIMVKCGYELKKKGVKEMMDEVID